MRSRLVRHCCLVLCLLPVVFAAALLQAQKAAPAAPVEGYNVKADPAFIAPTVAARTEPVEVFGQPRVTKGHPNTYWDQEDIDYYKERLKTSEDLQKLFARLKEAMDKRIAEPIRIPPPRKGADGKWLFPGEYFPRAPDQRGDSPEATFLANFSRDANDVSDLGTVYVLTGDEKYAEYARKLLLAYAHGSEWGINPGYNTRGEDGQSGGLLSEAFCMMNWARGYDLVYNLPSWTEEDRRRLHDEFFYPIALTSLFPGTMDRPEEHWFACTRTNRGLFGAVAVLMAGCVTDDEELINAALYGIHPTIAQGEKVNGNQWPPPKPWVVATAANPSYGLLTRYFAPDCIRGGMWVEPSVGYAFYSMGSMVGAAEILWHHGIDLYRHNNAIFKSMFDFPILYSYSDMTVPGIGSGRAPLFNGGVSANYEYAYRRYRDPRYLAMIKDPASGRGGLQLSLSRMGRAPTSLSLDIDPKDIGTTSDRPSVNWPLVGPGVLRTPAADGKGLQQTLILMSGPSVSKAAPDKLHVELFALGDILMPTPGSFRPYTQPILKQWYNTTLGQNTLTVDEKSQGSYYNKTRNAVAPHADQLVFAPAATLGLQRAWTDSVYAGVTMDRAVFMTSEYFADLFGAFSKAPHKYDLAWHIRGEASSELTFEPLTFAEPVADGYVALSNVRQASVPDRPWSITFTRDARRARLHGAAAPAAQVIMGDGGLFHDRVVRGRASADPTAPTILERRETSSTLYGNALDYSGDPQGYVKGVSLEGGLEAGYGLLKVRTAKGTDLCLAAYRPGTYKAGGLETDAAQAMVVMDGRSVRALYLAGGTTLKSAGVTIERGEPGLAYVERLPDGRYVLGNASPTEATVTVTLPTLAGMKALHVSATGQRGEAAGAATADGSFSAVLKANTTVELTANP